MEEQQFGAIGRELAANTTSNCVQARLLTFCNWTTDHIVRPQALAKAGFIYRNVAFSVFSVQEEFTIGNTEIQQWENIIVIIHTAHKWLLVLKTLTKTITATISKIMGCCVKCVWTQTFNVYSYLFDTLTVVNVAALWFPNVLYAELILELYCGCSSHESRRTYSLVPVQSFFLKVSSSVWCRFCFVDPKYILVEYFC